MITIKEKQERAQHTTHSAEMVVAGILERERDRKHG